MKKISLFHKKDVWVWGDAVHEYPKVYNKEGQELKLFYLKDQILDPYCGSQYFMWDRYNYGLNVHFYTHNNMLSTEGHPINKYGMLVESKQIAPDSYKIFDKNKGLALEFDSIFTYDAEILNKQSNAKFYPGCSRVWYGRHGDEFVWNDKCYQEKSKGISILSSDKRACDMHKLRIAVSRYCKKNGIADAYGTFDGGNYCLVDDTLKRYRYSIIVENDISDYFFTEKITNCFAAQTIPIYLGARQIDKFFNIDGIIQITEKQLMDIEKVIERCTSQYYEDHVNAVLDNYRRVHDYRNTYDWLYERYFSD